MKSTTNELVNLIDEYSNIFSSSKYAEVCCVYQYSLFDSPVYVGMSHNGHKNRFRKQLKSIFIDKNFNMKSPVLGYRKQNARDRFIYDIHEKSLNLHGLSLKILSLEHDNLGNDYEFVKDMIDRYSVSVYEQVLMNAHYRRGEDGMLLNKNPPANTSNALMTVRTKSHVVNDIREDKVTVYDFMKDDYEIQI
jgi:hypothetical protein